METKLAFSVFRIGKNRFLACPTNGNDINKSNILICDEQGRNYGAFESILKFKRWCRKTVSDHGYIADLGPAVVRIRAE